MFPNSSTPPTIEMVEKCQHPENQLEPVECLPDVVVCAGCGALLCFEGGDQPFRRVSAAELEARIYQTFQPAHEFLAVIDSALYDARETYQAFETIRRDNPVLKAERDARDQRIQAALRAAVREMLPGIPDPDGAK